MRHFALILQLTFFLLLPTVSPTALWAQAELTDDDRATAFVEVDIKRLRENELFKDIDLSELLSEGRFMPEIDIDGAVRFVFAGQCPDMETILEYEWQGEIPFSFYFYLSFDSPTGTAELLDSVNRLPEIEINGKSYRRPPADANVPNCLIHISETEFIFGTDDYVLNGNEKFLTDRLQRQLDQLPKNRMIRAGIDCVAGKKFLEQLFVQDRLEFPLPGEALVFGKPLLKLDSLVLCLDLEDSNLLDLIAHSPDAESATEFHATVSQYLNMAKLGVSMLSTQLETEEQKATFKELTNRLSAKVDGKITSVDVDQPEGFSEMVSALTAEMRREAQRVQEMNNFRQVALAIHNFESANRRFPFTVDGDPEWSDELSWRARILPYLDAGRLWQEIEMNKPWNSEGNNKFADQMPEYFGKDGKTSTVVWIKSNVKDFGDITDGSSNTIMLLQYPTGTPWLQPNDLSTLEAIRMIKELKEGEELMAARYDGSVFRISNRYTPNQLRALFSPDGGEVIDFDQ